MVTKRKASSVVVFSAACLMAASCGRTQEPKQSELKIVGGEEVDANRNDEVRFSTVALTTDYKKDKSKTSTIEDNHSFCSGTLVAPRVIVTAAHCLQQFDQTTKKKSGLILPEAKDFLVYFETRVKADGKYVRAEKVVPHPDWDPAETLTLNPTKAANDIGVIVLSEDAPKHMKPAIIASKTIGSVGQKAHIAGYGVTKSRNENDTGILRHVEVPMNRFDGTGLRIGVGDWWTGACAGDSGGPLYMKNGDHYEVAGATSIGAELPYIGCLGGIPLPIPGTEDLMNYYTDVRPYKGWVESFIK